MRIKEKCPLWASCSGSPSQPWAGEDGGLLPGPRGFPPWMPHDAVDLLPTHNRSRNIYQQSPILHWVTRLASFIPGLLEEEGSRAAGTGHGWTGDAEPGAGSRLRRGCGGETVVAGGRRNVEGDSSPPCPVTGKLSVRLPPCSEGDSRLCHFVAIGA